VRMMAALVCALGFVSTGALRAQDGLDRVVSHARAAWMGHDVAALLSSSDTVRLDIPGTVTSAAMKPGQAGRVLDKYLRGADERGFDLVRVRRLEQDHAYAELARVYVVKGTEEERRERVFFGFRQLDGVWRLREVRVTP
jgi:hypothetical protein